MTALLAPPVPMPRSPSLSLPTRVRRTLTRWLLAAFVTGLAAAALPAAAQDIYVGEAAVATQDAAERERALKPALLAALIRASGDAGIGREAAIDVALEDAPRIVRTFSYRQSVETGPDGRPLTRQFLVAQFDPDAVARILARLNRAVWRERPTTLVWLVIDDGSTKRIANAAQVGALVPFTRQAETRGIRVVFPTMDAEDAARVTAAGLWNDPPANALAAARRYGAAVALIVRLARTATGWDARYTLADGARPEEWGGNYSDANTALIAAAAGHADRLAARYAIAPSERVIADYRLRICGIDQAATFARVLAYLGTLSVFETFAPVGADGGCLMLTARLNVAPERFRLALATGGVLAFDEAALAEGGQIRLIVSH